MHKDADAKSEASDSSVVMASKVTAAYYRPAEENLDPPPSAQTPAYVNYNYQPQPGGAPTAYNYQPQPGGAPTAYNYQP